MVQAMTWQGEASARGWPSRQIETLNEFTNNPKSITKIERVTPSTIRLLSRVVFRIPGVGADGKTYVHEVTNERRWTWDRGIAYDVVATCFSAWCPEHSPRGILCTWTPSGCKAKIKRKPQHAKPTPKRALAKQTSFCF